MLNGKVVAVNSVGLGNFQIPLDTHHAQSEVIVSIRPEDISISSAPFPGGVEFIAYSVLPAGADTTIVAKSGDIELTIRVPGISKVKLDEKIWLNFNPEMINLYNKETSDLIV